MLGTRFFDILYREGERKCEREGKRERERFARKKDIQGRRLNYNF